MSGIIRVTTFDAIDPAVSKPHAVAHFGAGVLTSCRFVAGGGRIDPLSRNATAVVEVPGAAYKNATTHQRLTLAAMRAVARYEHVLELPANGAGAWKQGRKRQHQRLIWQALTPAERAVLSRFFTLDEASLLALIFSDREMHNISDMLDAVGLGLFASHRIDVAGRLRNGGET